MGMLLHIRTVRNHTFTLPFHCTNFLGHTFMLSNVQALQVAIAMKYIHTGVNFDPMLLFC